MKSGGPSIGFQGCFLRPGILAFGPNNSDTQELIKQTNSGIYCCYDEQDIKDKILDLYNNTDKFRVSDYERFSRKKLTQRLSIVLNDL